MQSTHLHENVFGAGLQRNVEQNHLRCAWSRYIQTCAEKRGETETESMNEMISEENRSSKLPSECSNYRAVPLIAIAVSERNDDFSDHHHWQPPRDIKKLPNVSDMTSARSLRIRRKFSCWGRSQARHVFAVFSNVL